MWSGGAGLAVAFDDPFVGGHLVQGHWAAGVELLGADAYLGSESELRSVGERCGRVDIDAGGVDKERELSCIGLALGDDALAVAGAVAGYVGYGFVNAGDGLDRHGVAEKFGAEARLVGFAEQFRRV